MDAVCLERSRQVLTEESYAQRAREVQSMLLKTKGAEAARML